MDGEILSLVVPRTLKDLLRIRAARGRTTVSDLARSILVEHVPEPSPEEALFLASNLPEMEESSGTE